MEIRLDTKALAALFPEGTEARVHLQNAVVAEFIRRHIKPSLVEKDVIDHIDIAERNAVNEVLNKLGATTDRFSGYGGSIKFSSSFIRLLDEKATESVNNLMSVLIHAYAESDACKRRVDNLVAKAIETRFSAALDKAVQDRLQAIQQKLATLASEGSSS